MQKKDEKTTMRYVFYSEKNGKAVTLIGPAAKQTALTLEKDADIVGYVTCVELVDAGRLVESRGIRKDTLKREWVSDFLVTRMNGTTEVIEAVDADELDGLRGHVLCERLELSRRYWKTQEVDGWKVMLCKRAGGR